MFAIGFRLPAQNRDWVRHELTDAGWRARLTLRHLLVTLPFAAVLAAFPGPLFIHIMVPALFLICSVGVVAMYGDDIRANRLRQDGRGGAGPLLRGHHGLGGGERGLQALSERRIGRGTPDGVSEQPGQHVFTAEQDLA